MPNTKKFKCVHKVDIFQKLTCKYYTWNYVLINNVPCHVNSSNRIINRYFIKLLHFIIEMHTLPSKTTAKMGKKRHQCASHLSTLVPKVQVNEQMKIISELGNRIPVCKCHEGLTESFVLKKLIKRCIRTYNRG